MSYQKTIIVGNLGQNPEIRQMNSGDKVANFSVAVSERWKDQAGQKQERTVWFRCVAFRGLAGVIESYVRKGSKVLIEGKIKTDTYTDNNGNERQTWQLVADQLQMLGGNQDAGQSQERPKYEPSQAGRGSSMPKPPTQNHVDDDLEDQIPF